MIKNLFVGFMIMGTLFSVAIFQFGRMILLNLELINLYRNQIVLGISVVLLIFTLFYKRIPLEWHPASMIYLSGSKFRKVFKLSLFKKMIPYVFLSILIAFILNNLKMNFRTVQIFMSLWNLFIISVVTRYFIYNKELNSKIVGFLLIYIMGINVQLYLNKYLSIILILYLTYISILCIKDALNTNFDFDKSFTDLAFINKAKYLARENITVEAQEFARETAAEKNRKNFILKYIQVRNPLIQKNLITFSRINFTLSIYLFVIFTVIFVLYRFELFEFVKTIKELGLGIPLAAFHQALLVNNIFNLVTEQKNLLVAKSKKGLYLPYKEHEIAKSFMVFGVPMLLIITSMAAVLLQKPIWTIGIETLLYSIVLLISLSFEKKKRSDFWGTVIYFLIFGISYLFII